jgi:hypothetical protein
VSQPPAERARVAFGRVAAKLRGLAGRHEETLRVFVSYRREAGPGQAHHLATDLERHLGAGQVFLDERAIGAGEDFDAVINERIGGADVLLAVIGPGWVDVLPRLFEERDYVRREIEAALGRCVPVIAIATPGATLPNPGELPDGLRSLFARPELTLDIPSDELWGVAVDSLGRWLLAIRAEKARHEEALRRASAARGDLERDLQRARDRAGAAASSVAAAQEREAAGAAALPEAQQALGARQAQAQPPRAGEGIHAYLSSRGETAAEAERLAGDLGRRFGSERIVGRRGGEGGVAAADVLLVLIGPRWLERDEGSASKPADPVAAELEEAIARRLAIIPLLTQRSTLPAADELPEALRPLLAHQALQLPEQFWEAAVGRLGDRVSEIERAITERERAVAAAAERLKKLERDLERARRDVAEGQRSVESWTARASTLDGELAAALEREQALATANADANPAYLAGPPRPA